MKVTIRRQGDGYSIYVAKKDLEEPVVSQEKPELWGGWIIAANGWKLALPDMPADTRMPITVEAKKLEDAA